jgi:hypothetical protein
MPNPATKELQRLLLILVGSVVILDGAVIGLYYAFGIPDRPMKTQEMFVAVWVVLTLLVVTSLMRRIRRVRREVFRPR